MKGNEGMKRIHAVMAMTVGIMAGTLAQAADKPGFTDTPMLPGGKWHVHDPDRPAPTVVTPAATPGGAPSDAIILFDGSSLAAWRAARARRARALDTRQGRDNRPVPRQQRRRKQPHLETGFRGRPAPSGIPLPHPAAEKLAGQGQ